MKKQWISIMLLLTVLCGLLPLAVVPAQAADAEVTRAEWIQSVVKTFSMTVEEDNYPDNYYTDLTGEEGYYRDILVAVEFGLIDQLPGTDFRPEDPATREFAAHTLNFALGYRLDDDAEYTFSEAESATYPDDIQVAVNRGWFALSGGAFLPEQAVTSGEAAAMLADAAKMLESSRLQEDYVNTFVYAEGVVEVPNGTAVEFVGLDTVYITYCPVTIAPGDTFVVYNGGFPVIGIAETVTDNEGILTVTYTEGPEDALVDFDYQTSMEADLEQFEGAGETTYTTRNGGTAHAGPVSHKITYNKGKKQITAKLPLNLANGIKASITVELSNIKITSKAKLGQEVTCIIDADSKVTGNVKVDYLKAADFPSSITIGTVKVAGVGTVTLEAEFDISGELVVTLKGHVEMGFQWTKYDGFRAVYSFKKKKFEASAEITVSVGLKITAGIDLFAASGNVWARMGETTVWKQSKYADETMTITCRDEQTYTYLKIGYYVGIKKVKSWNGEKVIYGPDRSNPTYEHYHYENGKYVGECTRGGSSSNNYTSPSSKWFSPGSSSGSGSYTGSDGKPVIIYTYSLDKNDNATITSYKGNAYALNIPKTLDGYTVTAIGEGAFSGNKRLHSVNIPDTVTSIAKKAFNGCTNLSSVILPDNLTYLGGSAFLQCDSLTEIHIPQSLKTAGTDKGGYNYTYGPFSFSGLQKVTFEEGTTSVVNNLFRYAEKLKEAELQDSMTTIGECSFLGCEALETITIPENVTTIQESAFAGCDALKEITIPNAVTSIGEDAFYSCDSLSKVKLSDNLTYLGADAFGYCESLTEIHIPKSLKNAGISHGVSITVGPFSFSGLQKVTFEEGTTSVVNNLFWNAEKLKDVELQSSMTTIGEYSFLGCKALEGITIPENVKTIQKSAFAGCDALKEITIPNAVTSIGEDAFYSCDSLSKVKLSDNLTYLGADAFGYCESLTEIHIPKSLKNAGISHGVSITVGPFSFSGIQKVTFEEGTASVLDNLFRYAEKLKDVELLSSMESIGECAFLQCKALEGITIPESITSLGESAFYGCSSLKEITVPSQVSVIRESTFSGCTSLATANLPQTITSIGRSAFYDCDALTEVDLPDELTSLAEYAFYDCDALTNLVIPDKLKTISSRTFMNSGALKTVQFGAAVQTIGGEAFSNCDALTSVEIGNKIKKIDVKSFYDCDSLETVKVGNSVTEIGTQAFAHCDVLKNVSLGFGLTKIGGQAFYECAVLEEIVIPYYVSQVDSEAFVNCPKLAKVVTHPNLTKISNKAFSYPDVTVFYGTADSYTQTWAKDNGYRFEVNTVAATEAAVPETIDMVTGETRILDLSVTPADFADAISYKSSNTDVVTVDEYGRLKAMGGGTATVKVTVGSVSDTCKVTVYQAVTRISLNKTKLSLNVPETFQLTAGVEPTHASNQTILWTSDNEAAATVDQTGLVTAVGNGTAVITAAAQDGSGISASCTVTVIDPNNIPVNAITLDKKTLTMEALDTYTLTATVKPDNAANKTLEWTSSDEAVAVVNEEGLVTAVGKGEAVISASATDGSGLRAECAVTVTNNAAVVTDLAAFESTHDYPVSCTDVWIYTAEDAAELKVLFDEQTSMEEGFDFLLIFDGQGNQIGKYTGKELAGQTVTVPGNTVKIQLQTDDNGTDWGFKVTSVDVQTHTHSYVPVVTPPTCTEGGYTTYTCECGDSYIADETAPVEHSWDAGVVTREATEDADGEETFTCTLCGETKTEPIPKLDHVHSYTSAVTDPTCTEGGYTTHTCSCGHSYTDSETEPLGHSWDAGVVTREATEDADGEKTFTCTLCGETKTEPIPKLNHVHNHTAVVTDPTCTEGGYTTHTCSCGHSYTDSETEPLGHDYESGICHICGEKDPDYTEEPELPDEEDETLRLAGANRWATSLMVAEEMKASLGVDKYDAVIITSGDNFADALAGSYLSAVKKAPILLCWNRGGKFEYLNQNILDYIDENLTADGTVYILGGYTAVPESFDEKLYGYHVERLAGANRFETNLMILEEAGVEEGQEILVCTSHNFADSLSASATGKPILLVYSDAGKLFDNQKAYLEGLKNCTFTILGGYNAVSEKMAGFLGGANRFETSVLVAQTYFSDPDSVVLAYAWNFPDGLCGGSLAYANKAPLILTMNQYEAKAIAYVQSRQIKDGTILGSEELISDISIRMIFGMTADAPITVK